MPNGVPGPSVGPRRPQGRRGGASRWSSSRLQREQGEPREAQQAQGGGSCPRVTSRAGCRAVGWPLTPRTTCSTSQNGREWDEQSEVVYLPSDATSATRVPVGVTTLAINALQSAGCLNMLSMTQHEPKRFDQTVTLTALGEFLVENLARADCLGAGGAWCRALPLASMATKPKDWRSLVGAGASRGSARRCERVIAVSDAPKKDADGESTRDNYSSDAYQAPRPMSGRTLIDRRGEPDTPGLHRSQPAAAQPDRPMAMVLGRQRPAQGPSWVAVRCQASGTSEIAHLCSTRRASVDFALVHRELRRTGVTLQQLWIEYREAAASQWTIGDIQLQPVLGPLRDLPGQRRRDPAPGPRGLREGVHRLLGKRPRIWGPHQGRGSRGGAVRGSAECVELHLRRSPSTNRSTITLDRRIGSGAYMTVTLAERGNPASAD